MTQLDVPSQAQVFPRSSVREEKAGVTKKPPGVNKQIKLPREVSTFFLFRSELQGQGQQLAGLDLWVLFQ